jgi:VWFA-related protein
VCSSNDPSLPSSPACQDAAAAPTVQAESTYTDTPAIFRAGVNVVVVPVVVRNRAGKSLGTLVKDDFRVFDDGKEQAITGFFIETAGGRAGDSNRAHRSTNSTGATDANVLGPPKHVAYLFDDLNLKFPELVAAKEAVFKYVMASLRAIDRVGIYSTSGRVTLEFTNDRVALKTTLLKMVPHPIPNSLDASACIRMTYALAHMIAVQHDADAGATALEDAITCMGVDRYQNSGAVSDLVNNAARQVIRAAGHNATAALAGIRYAVDRVAATPAPRTMVFISPGFVIPGDSYELMTSIDRAIRERVVIGALDARGVRVTGKLSDISLQVTASLKPDPIDHMVELVDTVQQAATLTELANGSGGTFVRGTNDLVSALNRLTEPPEHVYVLAFSRGDLRMNASYHHLTIKLRDARGRNITARRGYVMPAPDKHGR